MWTYLIKSTDSTYSAESEESLSHSKIMCDQSPIAKSTPIVKECCSHEWPMNHFATVLSGMTLRHWTEIYSKEPLTSFTAAFPARISALQDMEKAWQESEADYFTRSFVYFGKQDQNFSFWKTYQQSLGVEELKSLKKLPKWGLIVDGALYQLHPLEHCTDAKGGSYWLTLSTMEHLPVREGDALENALHRGKNRESKRKVSGRLNEQVVYPEMWPTPAARDWKDSGREPAAQARKSPCLPAAVMMATPTASQASKPIRKPSPSREKGEHGEDLQDSIGRLNPESIGKRLSVEFVELLMGYPSMYTACADWAIAWFLSKSKKRSKS